MKALKVVAIVLVVSVGLLAGLAYLGGQVKWYRQEDFFRAVDTGDMDKVFDELHPRLIEIVDRPVFDAFIKSINEHCGKFKQLDEDTWTRKERDEGGVTVTSSTGKVIFEKGVVEADIDIAQGKISSVYISTGPFPVDWFRGPTSTGLYRERAEKFLRHLLTGELDEAYAMMEPTLAKELADGKLAKMMAPVMAKAGKLKKLQFKSDQAEQGDVFKLRIQYLVECENDSTIGEVLFVFRDLKGHLIAFDLTGEGT